MFLCLPRTAEQWRRGGKEHRISGEIRPGAGLKTGHFVKEKLGGATMERLRGKSIFFLFCFFFFPDDGVPSTPNRRNFILFLFNLIFLYAYIYRQNGVVHHESACFTFLKKNSYYWVIG